MGVNNQILVGTACVGVIALVVAVDSKGGDPEELEGGGNPPPPDMPTNAAAQNLVDMLTGQQKRWVAMKDDMLLSTEACDTILRDLQTLRDRATRCFTKRRAHYTTDPIDVMFENQYAPLVSEIRQRAAKITDVKVEVEEVPADAGATLSLSTANPADEVSFDQGAGEAEPEIPEGFNTASTRHEEMVAKFSEQETSVTMVDKKPDGTSSAFVTQPDPLNSKDLQPGGGEKRADEEVADGIEQAPKKVVPPIMPALPWDSMDEGVEESLAIRADVIESEGVSFDTVDDPPVAPEKPIGAAKDPVTIPPAQKASRAELVDTGAEVSFNTDNAVAMDDDNYEEKIKSMRDRMFVSNDPDEIDALGVEIGDLERQTGTTREPGYTKMMNALATSVGKFNKYHGWLKRERVSPKNIATYVAKEKYWVQQIGQLRVIATREGAQKIYGSVYGVVKTQFDRDMTTFDVKKKRAAETAPTAYQGPPKKLKTGGEAAQAESGRATATGEPARKRSASMGVRRSARLASIKSTEEESPSFTDAPDMPEGEIGASWKS